MKKENLKIDIDLDEISEEIISLIPDLISTTTNKRMEARLKLEKMGPMVLEQISRLLESNNKQLRWEVAKSLECGSTIGSIPILLKLLADEESEIRWIAAEGLINIGRESIIPLLHELIFNESIYLNEGAHHVLQELLIKSEKRKYNSLIRALKQNKYVKGMASLRAKEIFDNYKKSLSI